MRAPVLAVLALSTVFGARLAAAGTISITISQRVTLADGALSVALTVSNGGDEAAQSVAASVQFRGQQIRGTLHPTLDPKGSFEETLKVPAAGPGDGRWPVKVAVDYTDANQYPFQALQVQMVTAGSPPPARVAVTSVQASGGITDTGDLQVTVKNLAADARTLTVMALVPEGLEATQPKGPISLAGWGEQHISIPITNRTALQGSRYPVFAVVEYDDGQVHQAATGQGIVEIVSGPAPLTTFGKPLWWVAGVVVVLWFGWLLVTVFRRQAPGRS